jgi:oligopeptide/dipeptide ABC transporter ATP-binding protein
LLTVEGLRAEYYQAGRPVEALRGVSLAIPEGASLALVGESGSGKSTVAMSVMGMLRPPVGRVTKGRIQLGADRLDEATEKEMRSILRHRIGFIPQDPTTALDPLYTIGSQIAEVLPSGRRSETGARTADLLEQLGVVNAADRLKSIPDEFSGGMRQRVAMAIALAKEPELLIADEPTTAVDVTTQLGILRLIDSLRSERKLTTLFITHDLRVARLVCQELAVMYAGKVVESGPLTTVMARPAHPYTRALLEATTLDVKPRTKLRVIPGQPPSIGALPLGCAFAPRCPLADERCWAEAPPTNPRQESTVECWKPAAP